MSGELDRMREQLVGYVVSARTPWNSQATVERFESAVRADERGPAAPPAETDDDEDDTFDVPAWLPCEWHARGDSDSCPLHGAHRWRGAVAEGRVDPPHEGHEGRLCWCVHGHHEVVDVDVVEDDGTVPGATWAATQGGGREDVPERFHEPDAGGPEDRCRIGGDGRCRVRSHYRLRA